MNQLRGKGDRHSRPIIVGGCSQQFLRPASAMRLCESRARRIRVSPDPITWDHLLPPSAIIEMPIWFKRNIQRSPSIDTHRQRHSLMKM